MSWPFDVFVGHRSIDGADVVTLDARAARLTPAEARLVAAELVLRADLQERNGKANIVDAIPRRKEPT